MRGEQIVGGYLVTQNSLAERDKGMGPRDAPKVWASRSYPEKRASAMESATLSRTKDGAIRGEKKRRKWGTAIGSSRKTVEHALIP